MQINIKKFTIFIITTICISSSINAQHITRLNSSIIEVNGEKHNFKESGEIFESVPIAYIDYEQAVRINKTANTLGNISIGALMGGLMLAASVDSKKYCDTFCLSTGQAIGVISVVVAFPLFGTIAIITKISAKKSENRAIHLYNRFYKQYNSLEVPEPSFGLAVGVTPNGVGFIVSF